MTNFVDDIFAKLDSKFSEHSSIKNSVMTSDGEIVRIDNDFWKLSPVLREHAVTSRSLKVVSASKFVLSSLIRAHEDGTFPYDLQESYDLLATAAELEMRELTSKCFNNLCIIDAFDDAVDFPSDLSLSTVMRTFKVLLDSPLRTAEVYEEQLYRIARYCSNNRDVITNALNVMRQSLEKFRRVNLEGIPVGFQTRMVPVVLYQRMGRVQTGIIVGSELKPVNLFGDHFHWEDITGIHGFYLNYGESLLYWCGESAYYLDLQEPSEDGPSEVLTECYIFVTRGKFVLAAHKDGDHFMVSLWKDEERFEPIYKSSSEITILEFDYETRVLAVQLAERKLLLFKFENDNLRLLEEREHSDVLDVLLAGGDMFYVRGTSEGTRIETHRLPALNDEESEQWVDDQPEYGRLTVKSENPTALNSLVCSGGSYFLTENERLELVTGFPYLDRTKTLLTDGELFAVSELWLSP